ncbi:hypothetical protein GCM10009559_48070 [Pseudonocardia zijingensis]|uniref:Uncharacterized protein n=1 Tax=Pseudonocardia zijingensis TaxID=153376 RepID=A0ABN1QWG0_9PSEU
MAGWASLPNPVVAVAAVPDAGARPFSARPSLPGAYATVLWSRTIPIAILRGSGASRRARVHMLEIDLTVLAQDRNNRGVDVERVDSDPPQDRVDGTAVAHQRWCRHTGCSRCVSTDGGV